MNTILNVGGIVLEILGVVLLAFVAKYIPGWLNGDMEQSLAERSSGVFAPMSVGLVTSQSVRKGRRLRFLGFGSVIAGLLLQALSGFF